MALTTETFEKIKVLQNSTLKNYDEIISNSPKKIIQIILFLYKLNRED